MTIFVLKLIAMITMLIDHLGIVLRYCRCISIDLYYTMRVIGRFAFPIYCFLLAEGFRHLRQDPKRMRLHALILMLLAVLSEPFFDQLCDHVFSSFAHQSVIFTLLLGFCGLWLFESFRDRPVLRVLSLLLPGIMGWLLQTDYGIAGVFLVFLFYFCLELCADRGRLVQLLGVFCAVAVYYLFYCWVHADFGGPAAIWSYLMAMGEMGIPHLLLVPILAAYSGRLGYRNRVLHRCYQFFYPAHLAALYLLTLLLMSAA